MLREVPSKIQNHPNFIRHTKNSLRSQPRMFTIEITVKTQAREGISPSGAEAAGLLTMKIGTTIRGHRLQKGLSQGDIEKKTGLLRCYLSRVENGHTIPSLDTLSKIAQALDVPISQFFAEDSLTRDLTSQKLADEELRFLTQIRRYSTNLNDGDRKMLLAMVKKFASTAAR